MSHRISEVGLPCTITITRLSPGHMDYDNLVVSQKWILDAVCDLLIPGLAAGRADGDPRISIEYAQERNKYYAVRIDIVF